MASLVNNLRFFFLMRETETTKAKKTAPEQDKNSQKTKYIPFGLGVGPLGENIPSTPDLQHYI